MKPFTLKTIRGITRLVTAKGTEILQGVPKLIQTKFGSYYAFPKATGRAWLTRVNLQHKVFNEYVVADGSRATVFLQTKTVAKGMLPKGTWHIDATALKLA